jgi:hypothetical protein
MSIGTIILIILVLILLGGFGGIGGSPFYGTGYYGGGGLGLVIVILLILLLMGRIWGSAVAGLSWSKRRKRTAAELFPPDRITPFSGQPCSGVLQLTETRRLLGWSEAMIVFL